jgi:hypothetical protein
LTGNASTATTLATARTINGTSFNGSADITIPNLVSGSSQITYSGLTGIPAGIVSGSSQITYSGLTGIPAGIVSGSSQVNADTITNFDPNVLAYNNSLAVVSGSKVVTIGSTAITLGGTATTIAGLTSVSSTGFSGSIASTNGVISGSSQVNADTITNFDPNVLAYNNSLAVVSGSAANVKTFLSLGNVTNESKATMFSSPTFTGTITASLVDTGQGATEVHLMNQNVRTTDSVTFAGITETSALKYKENIFSIEDTLDTVLKLRPVKYNIKGEEKVEIGLIAEEVHELVPELIKYNSKNEIDSIYYTRLAAVLIGAIKEQQIQINKLKEQIEINKK